MKILAEHIAQQLKERGFCVVFDRDLERCWPSGRMTRAEREREKSKRSPNLGVGLPHLSTLGPVRGQYFEKLEPGIRRGFDLISDELPFGRLWYEKPNDAVDYAKFRSRSHDAVIRVYDAAGNVIERHEHARRANEA